jgi:hypothetical protein
VISAHTRSDATLLHTQRATRVTVSTLCHKSICVCTDNDVCMVATNRVRRAARRATDVKNKIISKTLTYYVVPVPTTP